MKNSIVFILLCSTFFCLKSQPVIDWELSVGGSKRDVPYSLQLTSDNGYIVVGQSRSFDGDVTGNKGSADYWVVKFDSARNIQWEESLGGFHNDYGYSVIETPDGNYMLAGSSSSNSGDVYGNHGKSDMCVLMLNSFGNIIWQESIGGSNHDSAAEIKNTNDGGFIMVGLTYSDDGDAIGNLDTLNGNYWIVKLDSVGVLQWQKSYGGSDMDAASSVQQTYDGGYIVCGDARSGDGDVVGHHGFGDAWILKLDALGAIQWQNSMGGSSTEGASEVWQTPDGGYIVGGAASSSNGDVTGTKGSFDFWLVKLDSTGTIQWQKTLGGTGPDLGHSIQLSTDGGYIMTGSTLSNDGDVSGNNGNFDFWAVKVDSSGNIVWQKCLGGSDADEAFSVTTVSSYEYIVAGFTRSSDGDVSQNKGLDDYWIVNIKDCFPTFSTDSVTACDSFTWIDGKTYTSSNNSATYILPNASDCDSIIQLNLTINSVSDISTSISGLTITANNNNATYQWLDCENNFTPIPSATSHSYTPATNGLYAVQLTENNCIDTSACVNINSVSIDPQLNEQINFYPNPNQGQFTLDMGILRAEQINIYDMQGRLIHNLNDIQQHNYDLNLPSGIYLLHIKVGDKHTQLKLLIE